MTAVLPDHPDSRDLRPAERDALHDAIRRALVARGETGKAGIAAAVMRGGEVIATGENEVHLQADPTRHAEMVAITRAVRDLETSDLSDCVLISTLQFAFPHLKIADFQNWDGFEAVGGVCEDRVLHLYATGEE